MLNSRVLTILSKSPKNAILKNMHDNNAEIIFPCPFSNGYGIPARQAWTLLKVYSSYRFILACLLNALFYNRSGISLLGSYDMQFYIYSIRGYLAACILSVICLFWRPIGYSAQAQLLIFTDIIFLTLLMHACGGIGSGVGILLAASIAAGGLLVGGRCALVFAAMASLAILAEQVYASITHSFVTTSYANVGMLGAAFFAIAGIDHLGHPSLDFLVRPWAWPNNHDLFLMALCGAIAAVAMSLLTNAYRMADANLVTVFEYTGMIWSPLWGFLFFNEIPRWTTVAGLVLIFIAGLISISLAARRPSQPDASYQN